MGEKNSKLKPNDLTDLKDKTEFTEKEIKEWYRGFKEDYPDGYLTVDTFRKMYSNIYPRGDASAFAENIFRIFDHNKDNRIDFHEFIIALSISSRGSSDDKMKWIFQLYDSDNNGYISKEEMLVIVKAIYQMANNTGGDSAAERKVEKIYNEMDTDSDDQLSMEEFLVLAKSDPTVLNVLTGDMAMC